MYRIVACVLLLSGVLGEIVIDAPCNFENITKVTDLNITRLVGEWNQLKRLPNSKEAGACPTLTVAISSKNGSNPDITVSNRVIVDKTAHYKNGTIFPDNKTQGLFVIRFSDISYNTIMLATDYSKYALMYSCLPINTNQSSVLSWVYSKQTSLQTVEQDESFKAAINGTELLRNASWIVNSNSPKSCKVNSGVSFGLSPILALFAVIIVGKDFVFCN